MDYRYLKPGLGNTASYQVSGIPWVSSSVAPSSGEIVTFSFPLVTKFIVVKNISKVPALLDFAFDKKQLEYGTGECIRLSEGESITLNVKVADIHFVSADSSNVLFSVAVGLTGITRQELPQSLVTSDISLLTEQGISLTTEDGSYIIAE
jgi:hypothetical protein